MGQPVGGQQVLGHVGVEAGAEDPEVPLDDERQRGGEQRRDATGIPSRSASPAPSTRPRQNSSEARVATRTAIAEMTPSPGSRTVPQHSAVTSASPTAGAQPRPTPPTHSASAAWPIASEAGAYRDTAA